MKHLRQDLWEKPKEIENEIQCFRGTEEGIANRLMEMGVPKQDIILAFHEPYVGQFTGFGTGEASFSEMVMPKASYQENGL